MKEIRLKTWTGIRAGVYSCTKPRIPRRKIRACTVDGEAYEKVNTLDECQENQGSWYQDRKRRLFRIHCKNNSGPESKIIIVTI